MVDDDKASLSVIREILQNVVTAEQTGKRAENTSVYCGKTKVFMANSVVRVLFPWLTVLERTCIMRILAQISTVV